MTKLTHGRLVGLIWTGGDYAIRWQVYVPCSRDCPSGQFVAGGTWGQVALTEEDAMAAVEAAFAAEN